MTVRVLVTSDTHLKLGARLPDALLVLADRADHVIHAGDLIRVDVLDTLGALAPITAVCGNVDDAMVASLLPEQAQVELAGVRFGVVHDPGPARGRRDRLCAWFPRSDVIVYGHTHAPEIDRSGDHGPLIINPGSPTQRRRAPWHSACWLELDAGHVVAADIIRLDEPH